MQPTLEMPNAAARPPSSSYPCPSSRPLPIGARLQPAPQMLHAAVKSPSTNYPFYNSYPLSITKPIQPGSAALDAAVKSPSAAYPFLTALPLATSEPSQPESGVLDAAGNSCSTNRSCQGVYPPADSSVLVSQPCTSAPAAPAPLAAEGSRTIRFAAIQPWDIDPTTPQDLTGDPNGSISIPAHLLAGQPWNVAKPGFPAAASSSTRPPSLSSWSPIAPTQPIDIPWGLTRSSPALLPDFELPDAVESKAQAILRGHSLELQELQDSQQPFFKGIEQQTSPGPDNAGSHGFDPDCFDLAWPSLDPCGDMQMPSLMA